MSGGTADSSDPDNAPAAAVFCRSCGGRIAPSAVKCPDCGAVQTKLISEAITRRVEKIATGMNAAAGRLREHAERLSQNETVKDTVARTKEKAESVVERPTETEWIEQHNEFASQVDRVPNRQKKWLLLVALGLFALSFIFILWPGGATEPPTLNAAQVTGSEAQDAAIYNACVRPWTFLKGTKLTRRIEPTEFQNLYRVIIDVEGQVEGRKMTGFVACYAKKSNDGFLTPAITKRWESKTCCLWRHEDD